MMDAGMECLFGEINDSNRQILSLVLWLGSVAPVPTPFDDGQSPLVDGITLISVSELVSSSIHDRFTPNGLVAEIHDHAAKRGALNFGLEEALTIYNYLVGVDCRPELFGNCLTTPFRELAAKRSVSYPSIFLGTGLKHVNRGVFYPRLWLRDGEWAIGWVHEGYLKHPETFIPVIPTISTP